MSFEIANSALTIMSLSPGLRDVPKDADTLQKTVSGPIPTPAQQYGNLEAAISRSAGPNVSIATLVKEAKEFPDFSAALKSLPQNLLVPKMELRDILQALRQLDSNGDLKVSASEANSNEQNFPELKHVFKEAGVGAQISAAWVFTQMLSQHEIN